MRFNAEAAEIADETAPEDNHQTMAAFVSGP
jgi:hypothetical protein